jgi:hypothetical protein
MEALFCHLDNAGLIGTSSAKMATGAGWSSLMDSLPRLLFEKNDKVLPDLEPRL